MFIAAIIAVFVLTTWFTTYVRSVLFNEGSCNMVEVMTWLPALCITFLLVYYNVI